MKTNRFQKPGGATNRFPHGAHGSSRRSLSEAEVTRPAHGGVRALWIPLGLLLLACTPAQAQTFTNSAGLVYTTNGGAVTITGYAGAGGALTIPGFINSLPVTNIGNGAFLNKTNLTSVGIGTNVTSIGEWAFEECSMRIVVIPGSVTNIGNYAFAYCGNLTNISVDASSASYSSLNGVLFNKSQTLLIQFPGGDGGGYTIPNNVASIGDNAFEDCDLTNIAIPGSLTNIGNYAFAYGCRGWRAITIPDSVVSIGDYAFWECGLTNVTIGSGLASIGEAAFGDLALLNIAVAAQNPNYSSLDGVLFNKSQTLLVLYPMGWTTSSYAIPSSVASIGDYAFESCNLTSVAIPNSVTNIGDYAFGWCDFLTNIAFPDNLASIGQYAFADCPFTSVSIPDSVANIGYSAFLGCPVLTNVTIGSGVIILGTYAFQDCGLLEAAYFLGNAPSADSTAFAGDTNATVYYFAGTSGWGTNFGGAATEMLPDDALQGTIGPAAAVSAGAGWQVDGGPIQSSGATVTNLVPGNHTVSFTSIPGWTAPASQMVAIASGQTNTVTGAYIASQYYLTMNAGSNGVVSPASGTYPAGTNVSISAAPSAGYVFGSWTGTGNGSYSGTNNPALVTMNGPVTETANFVPGEFIPEKGTYYGLFCETNGVAQQSSGAFTATTTTKTNFSGSLQIGSAHYSFSGKFDSHGFAQVPAKRPNSSALTVSLQLDLTPGSDLITGTVSTAGWTAEMTGYRLAANGLAKAGRYTLIIAGTNSAAGPDCEGIGAVTLNAAGKVALAGSMADGAKLSQSSSVVGPGLWPLYVPLYGGSGSIMSWVSFSNSPAAALGGALSWINPKAQGAGYHAVGFAVLGSYYSRAAGQNVLDFTDGELVLTGGGLEPGITNGIVVGANNRITDTNGNTLHLTFTPSSGAFTGSLKDSAVGQTIHFNGVVLENTNAAFGYFLNDGQSGWLYIGRQ
jgi:hypothetical protein